MKSQLVILVLVGFLAFAHCFPGATRNRDESDKTDDLSNVDTVLIIPSFDNGFGRSGFGLGRIDLDDDEDATPFNPFHFNFRPIHNPFSGIWENLQNTMKRLRDQMSRLPTSGISYPFGKIPESANKTSTTKIIDGHIVTINETTYNDDDSNSTFVFKIRTVDIQPENGTDITGFNDGGNNGDNVENVDNSDNGGGEQIEKDKDSKSLDSNNNETTTERSVETVEDPGNNEIPDNQVETLTA